MFSKLKFDTVIAILLLVLSFVFWVDIGTAPKRVQYYPRSVILIMAIPTVMLLIRSLIPKYQKKLNDFRISMNPRVFVTIVATILYILLIPIVGYFITTSIFICGIMIFLGARSFLIIGSVTVGVVLFIYFMFNKLLLISLPRGFLF